MIRPAAITALEPDAILSAARRSLGITGGSLGSWHAGTLWTPRLATTSGVYRVDAVVEHEGLRLESFLVLKVISRRDAHHLSFEAELYASGVLDELPEGLEAPRWYGNVAIGTDHTGVWLSPERDDLERVWNVERFGIAARHLGRLAGRMCPVLQEHAIRRPVRSFWNDPAYVEETMRTFADTSRGGRAQCAWPPRIRRGLIDLWSERDSVLMHAEALPVTLCHGDAQRRNLFARRDATVAIDWANFSMAPVGMDIVTLVHYALAYFDIDSDHAADLEKSVLAGYAQGLEDMGASIDRETIWFGYAIQLVYGRGLLETGPMLRLAHDPAGRDGAEAFYGQRLGTILDRRAAVANYLVDVGSRIRQGCFGVPRLDDAR